MSTPTREATLLLPAEWLQLTEPGTQIMDYDGWRDQPFDQPVTLEEFQRRLAICTLMIDRRRPDTINLNRRVRVKLTPTGVAIISRLNREIHRQNEQDAGRPVNYTPHYKMSSDGHLVMQLWELFHVLGGKHMPEVPTFHGIPFETEVELL